jgi:peptidoglycan hydrolase-like protein with peptidoglycan-binding domain
LIANVKEFGFSWEVVPSEPWHLRYVCGDDVPAAVLAFQGGAIPTLSAPAPAPTSGSTDHKELQEALKAKGFYKGTIDGLMSDALKDAIKAFKVANKLKADDIVGPKVKELLGLK